MIDLHTHSTHSDGILTINQLVSNAVNNGVDVISITDHDTITGVEEYRNNILRDDIAVIPGIEFSTDTYFLGKKTKIHLLGYGYDVDDEGLKYTLSNLHKRRFDDNKEYVETLIKKFTYLSKDFFLDFNYGKYGWIHKRVIQHVGNFLTEEQLATLKRYMLDNQPHYNKYNESVEDMIELTHTCNGYAVFAHPQQCKLDAIEMAELVKYLSSLGLDGIETYHLDSNFEERNVIHNLAKVYDLYETGGSDFHNFDDSQGVGDPNIRFPDGYDSLLVKRLIREKKVLGGRIE